MMKRNLYLRFPIQDQYLNIYIKNQKKQTLYGLAEHDGLR
jgi:hypothetical protein